MAHRVRAIQSPDKSGEGEQVAAKLQPKNAVEAKVLSLDSTSIKAYPDAHRALRKSGKQATGKPCGGWNTKIHAITTNDAAFVKFRLSAGNASGAKEGQFLLESVGKCEGAMLLIDRAYEDNKTWEFTKERGIMTLKSTKSATALSDSSVT